MDERDMCVACGKYAGEGRMICIECEKSLKKMDEFTNEYVQAYKNDKRRRELIKEYSQKIKDINDNKNARAYDFYEKKFLTNAISILKSCEVE